MVCLGPRWPICRDAIKLRGSRQPGTTTHAPAEGGEGAAPNPEPEPGVVQYVRWALCSMRQAPALEWQEKRLLSISTLRPPGTRLLCERRWLGEGVAVTAQGCADN